MSRSRPFRASVFVRSAEGRSCLSPEQKDAISRRVSRRLAVLQQRSDVVDLKVEKGNMATVPHWRDRLYRIFRFLGTAGAYKFSESEVKRDRFES